MTYRITFLPMDRTVDVDPATLEEPRDGQRGSILQLALENHIDLRFGDGRRGVASSIRSCTRYFNSSWLYFI